MSADGEQIEAEVPAPPGQEPSEEAWKLARERPIRGSELRLELGMTAAFLLVGVPLAVTAQLAGDPLIIAAVVLAFSLAALVEFPIAGGSFTPTQLMLVPLFVVAPAGLVPLLILVAFLVSALIMTARGQQALDRVVFCAGDAMHSLGPAIVIVAFAGGDAAQASAIVIAAAFAAQLSADFVAASVHELISIRAVPGEHARVMLRIWGVDLALGSIGALAAWLATDDPLFALAPLPLVLLLGRLAADRMKRIDAAREREVALELERGRRETALAQLERQVSFLQDVSHELRTPVTIARGHVDNARRETGQPPKLDVALDELGRIDRMIERLLMMARAEQPELLNLRELDTDDFLEDRFVRWSDTVPRQWQLGDLAEGVVAADPDALNAVLDALLENAVKYTDATQPIELSSYGDRGSLVISVADNGPGIPADALEQIFDRFGRADQSDEARVGGSGLGLAMVDAVARAHGGRCLVESSPGGTRFLFRLPGFRPAGRPPRYSQREHSLTGSLAPS